MHVGWSLLLTLIGIRLVRRRLARFLVFLHPVLMTLAVTATGNHFFVDALAGMAVALLGYALVSCRALRRVTGARIARLLHLGSGRCPALQAA